MAKGNCDTWRYEKRSWALITPLNLLRRDVSGSVRHRDAGIKH